MIKSSIETAPTTYYINQANKLAFIEGFSHNLFNFFVHHWGVTHREIERLFERRFNAMVRWEIAFMVYTDHLRDVMSCSKRFSPNVQNELRALFTNSALLFE